VSGPGVSRRSTLAALGCAALGLACERPRPDRRLRVALASLPAGGRAVFEHLGEPVEVRRTDGSVQARSLLCSHYGCRVQWQAGRGQYLCPCHQGTFDADGRPVSGPPTRPLRAIPVALSGETALVGEP
jgi:cytochrome b6-f complex iron-sulfur subunit